ncbi:winged helix-turn-helix domain-containing protein [Halostella salina]|uniref:winged helix-turn-helix domain-containing protein n=1 Tax=Halostella salina TaxID=1547897 RepID=UPI0013CF28E5|nr:winged helix-turn-helix domain-containing protein [Halostella salina]
MADDATDGPNPEDDAVETDPPTDASTRIDPADAFDALGDGTRLAIVETLAAHRRENWAWSGLSFSELRKAVGVRDAGRFNYHLDQLLDTFVVDDDGEYVLTTAGMEVAGAIRAGTYTERRRFRTSTDRSCPGCGAEIEVAYRHGTLLLTCPEHGVIFGNSLPGGAVADREPTELLALADMKARRDTERARRGACVHCWGTVTATMPAEPPDGEESEQVLARLACEDCGMVFRVPAAACVVDHPAVVSFHYERGVDIRDQSYLDMGFLTGENGEVVSEDPVRVRVDVELDGDRLTVLLDESTAVVSVDEP